MVAQVGIVLLPYGPGLRELGDLWYFAHISGGVYEVHGALARPMKGTRA